MDSGDDGVDETWRLERFLLRFRRDFISSDGISGHRGHVVDAGCDLNSDEFIAKIRKT
jgi:hypothetical protein